MLAGANGRGADPVSPTPLDDSPFAASHEPQASLADEEHGALAPSAQPSPIAAPPSAAGAPSPPQSAAVALATPPVQSRERSPRADPLDPTTRHAAQLAPVDLTPAQPSPTSPPPPDGAADVQAHASLESLLPELVRRVAWSGDGRRGSMRLELGAGTLAGGILVVHADDGRVRVELDAPSGTDGRAWEDRLRERLARRGVEVDDVTVR